MAVIRVLHGDCRDVLPQLEAGSVHCVVTSPPIVGECASPIRYNIGMGKSQAEALAYCAGVVDSDGYIGIKRSTYSMRVTVKQVEIEAVALLYELFGGTFGLGKPTARRGRPLHTWQVTDRRAAACLRALLPFLRIKRQQAENCLALRDTKEASKTARVAFGRGHRGSAHRLDIHTTAMQEAYERGKALNAVGVRQ